MVNEEEKKEILVVDDVPANLQYIQGILSKKYDIACAKSGEKALMYLKNNTPSLILLDVKMPNMDGFEVMRHVQQDNKNKNIPVIFMTAFSNETEELQALEMGAVDFIRKPFIPQVMLKRIDTHIELYSYKLHLEEIIEKDKEKIEQVSVEAVVTIAQTVEAKDAYTQTHSRRVAEYATDIARHLGWSEEDVKDLYTAGLLHDIGKIGVPDGILNKKGRLTDEEYSIMKKHVNIGHDILNHISTINGLTDGALYHHERYDGRGYCNGLKGEEIPLSARIIGIADALDAMTSDRVYRVRLPISQVLGELENGRGTQFDPNLVDFAIDIAKKKIFHIKDE